MGTFPLFQERVGDWKDVGMRNQPVNTPHQTDMRIHPQVKGTISLEQLNNKSNRNQPVSSPLHTSRQVGSIHKIKEQSHWNS
jgi:hypothetical protein